MHCKIDNCTYLNTGVKLQVMKHEKTTWRTREQPLPKEADLIKTNLYMFFFCQLRPMKYKYIIDVSNKTACQ